MVAADVFDGGEDELDVFSVKAGEVSAEVDGRSSEERCGDAEQAGLAARERAVVVLGHLLGVDPPPAGVVALLDPWLAGVGEPAVEGLEEEFDAGLERVRAFGASGGVLRGLRS